MEQMEVDTPSGVNDKRDCQERTPSVLDIEMENPEDLKPKGAKRRRMRGPGPSDTQRSRRKTPQSEPSLSLLPTMPLDILFEIFGYLDVHDVINLSRTSKAFRNTLFHPSASSVWRNLRKPLDAPDPLGNMSEARWAELLFGIACQDCGGISRISVHKANFFVRRRLCKTCQKRSLIAESKLNDHFNIPSSISIRAFIPSVRVEKEDEDRCFYRGEVEVIIKKVNAFEKALRRENAPEVTEKYNAFKVQRQQVVLDVLKRANKCAKWLNQYFTLLQASKDQITAQRRAEIFERLRQMGYADEDIERQSLAPEVNQPKPVDDRVLQKIIPSLERKIRADVEQRREHAIDQEYESRKTLVDELYTAYRKTRHPTLWMRIPRTEEIFQLPSIKGIIEAPLAVHFTAQHVARAMMNFGRMLRTLEEAKCWKYFQLLQRYHQAGNHTTMPGDIPFDAVLHTLDLATSVFECHQDRKTHPNPFIMVGTTELLSHHCDPEDISEDKKLRKLAWSPSTRLVSFSPAGADVARALLKIARLDPATARVSEMDGLGLRFRCKKETSNWKQYEYNPDIGFYVVQVAYPWREAIAHALLCRHGCDWEAYSGLDAEVTDARWTQSKWSCSHCHNFLPDNLKTRQEIFDHVRTFHGKVDPQEHQDFFFFERFRTPAASAMWEVVKPEVLDAE